MLQEIALYDPAEGRELGIKTQIRNVPCGKISRRKLRHECPVDDCVVLENYTLSDALLRHLTPDGEVAGIAAKLTFGERSSLVAFDRRGVIAEPFGQIGACFDKPPGYRSEEHTSELQSLMRTSYAVFCLK